MTGGKWLIINMFNFASVNEIHAWGKYPHRPISH